MTRPMALEADPAVWTAEALAYVEARARAGLTVTADDVRRDLPPAPHPNAVGPVFKVLAGRKVIEKTAYGASTARLRKGGPRFEWRLHHSQVPRRSKAWGHVSRLVGRAA